MEKYLKVFIKRFFLGGVAGIALNYFIFLMIVRFNGTMTISYDIMLQQFLISFIVGATSAGLSVVYIIKNLSMLVQTSIHFILGFGLYIVLGAYAGWFKINFINILLMLVLYFVVWCSFYLSSKYNIKKINKAVMDRNNK